MNIPFRVADMLSFLFATSVSISRHVIGKIYTDLVRHDSQGTGLSGSVGSHCDCSSGSLVTTLPMMTSTDKPCGYVSLPSPTPTSAPLPLTTAPPSPFPYTFTDSLGDIIACASASFVRVGGKSISHCGG